MARRPGTHPGNRPGPFGGPFCALIACMLLGATCGGAQKGAQPLGLRDRDTGSADPGLPAPAQTAPLVGQLCANATAERGCRCRTPGEPQQTPPPPEGSKRLEVRMSATGGRAVLESEQLGRFEVSGATERCFYLDVPSGTKGRFRFHAVADNEDSGVDPELSVTEYGPSGPYWYDILYVDCKGPAGRCDRGGADAWRESLRSRLRGRLDPCGSAVVTNLGWDTSGGQHERDGGLYRDFTVTFAMEWKKFATQFAPGSTECVPK